MDARSAGARGDNEVGDAIVRYGTYFVGCVSARLAILSYRPAVISLEDFLSQSRRYDVGAILFLAN
jgi:hypothetical protein